ncbi:hypothetical protein M2280_005391 [Prescottella agglutinans]|uniref:Uncharacterized protein n=1 Tax=Prescottella agglutinans TaxID=1644129 RepID=A0ABT6MLB2_9NOCA|nr:hypothetical protein [Prescottella agglutinans]
MRNALSRGANTSSPFGRGGPSALDVAERQRRSIPAWAGQTGCCGLGRTARSVDPRTGGAAISRTKPAWTQGGDPRMCGVGVQPSASYGRRGRCRRHVAQHTVSFYVVSYLGRDNWLAFVDSDNPGVYTPMSRTSADSSSTGPTATTTTGTANSTGPQSMCRPPARSSMLVRSAHSTTAGTTTSSPSSPRRPTTDPSTTSSLPPRRADDRKRPPGRTTPSHSRSSLDVCDATEGRR